MSSLSRTLRLFVFLLPAIVLCGCQKARNYDPRTAAKKSTSADKPEQQTEKPPAPIPADFAWEDDTIGDPASRDFPIEFVSEGTQPAEWKKLKLYWNDPGLAGTAAIGLSGLPGMAALAAAQTKPAVKIKVPLGLDDPLAYIPAANPPTRGKWELGRRLFFDTKWLTSKGDQSCATCHIPTEGFANHKPRIDTFNTPTLLNCVYNTHQFQDGRAVYLEEVVQRTLEDEREPKEAGPFKHVWHGVIGRLRNNKSYLAQFERVFGVSPTQDAVGKALATYLRTLLSAGSIHDRAVQEQHSRGAGSLAVKHYEAVLNDADLKALDRPKAGKAAVAKELLRGSRLFIGKASCVSCHSAGNGSWSDGRFHNIGVGADEIDPAARMPSVLGRFAWAPYGERTRYLRGAFKTPTLRSLLRTAPYFHNGQEKDLAAVVRFHVEPNALAAPLNRFLDPKLADASGAHRNFGLKKADVQALVLFLAALNGEVDPFLTNNPNGIKVAP